MHQQICFITYFSILSNSNVQLAPLQPPNYKQAGVRYWAGTGVNITLGELLKSAGTIPFAFPRVRHVNGLLRMLSVKPTAVLYCFLRSCCVLHLPRPYSCVWSLGSYLRQRQCRTACLPAIHRWLKACSLSCDFVNSGARHLSGWLQLTKHSAVLT